MPHLEPYTAKFTIEGHDIRAKLKDLLGTDQMDVNNSVGAAARKTKNYNPGLAEAAVIRAGIEMLYIDNEPRKFKSAFEIPLYWDDNLGKSLNDMLIGHILRLRSARFLLDREEYKMVFEDYVFDEDYLEEDMDPTG